MRFNETLLIECEEFLGNIINEENNQNLTLSMEALRDFLEKDVDGWTNSSDDALARAAQCRMMEIWGLISRGEKSLNPDLKEYYDEIVSRLENVSGHETDADFDYEGGPLDVPGGEP